MGVVRWCLVLVLVGGMLLGSVRVLYADAGDQTPVGEQMFAKLGRGLANAATGWIEIPKRMHDETAANGPGVGWTWGLIKGVGYAIARSVAGAYEIVSFPVAMPEAYQPVIDPPLIFSAEETRAASPK